MAASNVSKRVALRDENAPRLGSPLDAGSQRRKQDPSFVASGLSTLLLSAKHIGFSAWRDSNC